MVDYKISSVEMSNMLGISKSKLLYLKKDGNIVSSETDNKGHNYYSIENIRDNIKNNYKKKHTNIICVANRKGGVGKTTTTINMALTLELFGFRVLVVDGDEQGNLSNYFLHNPPDDITGSLTDVFFYGPQGSSSIQKTRFPDLKIDVISSNPSLGEVETANNKIYAKFKSFVNSILDRYDFILIDTPPSRKTITDYFLAVATGVVIPVAPIKWALEGIGFLHGDIETNKEIFEKPQNVDLKILGCFLNMIDTRKKLDKKLKENLQQIENNLGINFFKTVIPSYAGFTNAVSLNKPYYDVKPIDKKKASLIINMTLEVVNECQKQ